MSNKVVHQGCPIESVFRPTDLVISGQKQHCDDFFSVLGSEAKNLKMSPKERATDHGYAAFTPDSMSPAYVNVLDKE